jgi:predicted nucleic acid-binding protein
MTAVDTNILFYAHDSRNPLKQKIANDLIGALADGVLLWQVACEYLWASRKLEIRGYSYVEAADDVRGLRRAWKTVLPTWPMLDRIEALKLSAGLSYWDALLAGTCIEAGIETLYSEDFGTLPRVGPLTIVNPFH